MRRTREEIYRSHRHVVATVVVAALPFVFFWIFARFNDLVISELFFDFGRSTLRLCVAYVLSLIIAWGAAIAFYRGRRASFILPAADILQSFPTFAALPLATLFLGKTDATVIIFLVLTMIWPIFFSIISSLKRARKDWEEVAEMSRLKGYPYFRYFLFPLSTSGAVTGSIIGLGEGWEALIATEIIVGMNTGLGEFFNTFSHDTSITVFGILGFLLFIFSLNKILFLPLLDKTHNYLEE